MIITLEFAQARFDAFNQQIFGGKLPRVPITLGKARRQVGSCAFTVPRVAGGASRRMEHAYDFRLRFSTCFDMPPRQWEDVVIHEMIHLSLAVNRITDDGVHGTAFRRLMNEINTRFHRQVAVRHDNADGSTVVTTPKRWVVVAIVKYADGHLGVKVLPRVQSSILRYYSVVKRVPGVLSVELSLTCDTFFARYPKSSALKVYAISREDAELHLRHANRIICNGHKLEVCRS